MSDSILKDAIDMDKLIKDIFGSDKNRNDLAIGVKNNTTTEINIDYYIDHGSLKKIKSTDANKIAAGQIWEAGIIAKGEGSNIGLKIETSTVSFAVIAATPSNKQNYFKFSHSKKGYHSGKTAWKAANKHDKHYSDNGYLNETYSQKNILINITGESPATCCITISDN
ncbi:hypothetical protein [Tenacibaculum ovolyticum]|uniref:hypothetical protein n=1 Tax=Tenacibaculum ovolyticum TaxID=104270 RepID=UPI003BA89548